MTGNVSRLTPSTTPVPQTAPRSGRLESFADSSRKVRRWRWTWSARHVASRDSVRGATLQGTPERNGRAACLCEAFGARRRARGRLARGMRRGRAPASLQDKEPRGISKGLTAEQQTRPPVQGETPPYPASPGCESRHDTGGPCRRSVVAGSAGVQWHDGRRAAPSLDQTVRGVAPRLLAPLVVSQGCTVTSRLCMSLDAVYRALSSSLACSLGVYMREGDVARVGCLAEWPAFAVALRCSTLTVSSTRAASSWLLCSVLQHFIE